jgi:hypothetical protein
MKLSTYWKLFLFFQQIQKEVRMGKFLSGYKTYIAGIALIALGIKQAAVDGQLDAGLQSILAGIAIMSGRSAIAKVGK